jgi:hypothetical protein
MNMQRHLARLAGTLGTWSATLLVCIALPGCTSESVTGTVSGSSSNSAVDNTQADATAVESVSEAAGVPSQPAVAATMTTATSGSPPSNPVTAVDGESAAAEVTHYANPITAAEAAEGWISLFDGQTLFGWSRHGDGANWRVEDGAIVADDGPIDLLCTSVPFSDYELQFDFQMEAGGNSGVFLRTPDRPENPAEDCYELNIADSHPQGFTTGAFVGRKATEETIIGSGDWKTMQVVAQGNHFLVTINEHPVLSYVDEGEHQRASGLIGLQKNQGRIAFRNIRLRPLELAPLFNGNDLSGWRVPPGGLSEFGVADGTITVKNGRGFLETDSTWGDFVFQAEARTNAPELNSGYFFRALPIEPAGNCNGYEAQISNAVVDGDRRNPKDHGTGAIFRRVQARYVVPNDGEWFTTTLVAAGPQIAVWVDGYQVVDWRDERPAHENPREGSRIEPGHIALQGHDPTTDLSFRNLRIAELPATP